MLLSPSEVRLRLVPPARFHPPSPPSARRPALTRSSVASSETSARAQGRGSLLYADVPEDVRAMAAELESLGGCLLYTSDAADE